MEQLKKIDFQELKKYIKDSSKESAIYLGCDSKQLKKHTIYAVCCIIHIDGKHGGKIFFEKYRTKRIKDISTRLLKEVELVVNLAQEIIPVIDNRKFEVHLDLNGDAKHKSNVVAASAKGWVEGLGLLCKIKPESFAATHAADHCCII